MDIGILVSGGVDSSVAAALLARAGGHRLRAYYLKIWLEDDVAHLGECPWEDDLGYVREVCDQLDLPLEVIGLQREYRDRVVSYTLAELRAGRTPSPDIFCNQRVKFGAFHERLGGGLDAIASGHYARTEADGEHVRLLRGVDPVKDQTYFLSHLSQDQVARCLFPIGHLPKSEVRRHAQELELPTRDRPDSQGICFLGKISFDDFVRHHLGERTGAIVERESGKRLGEHRGYWFHTIGQRRGLGLGQGPWFVVDKEIDDNIVYVSHQEDLAQHSRQEFEVTNVHWIGEAPELGVALTAKVRHGPTLYECRLAPAEIEGNLVVTLDRTDPGVAPGQFAIFYDGEACLGGGTIC